jgi:hypothetical protein
MYQHTRVSDENQEAAREHNEVTLIMGIGSIFLNQCSFYCFVLGRH